MIPNHSPEAMRMIFHFHASLLLRDVDRYSAISSNAGLLAGMSGYDKVSFIGHTALSAVGTVPVLGIVADVADFVLTAAEIPFGKSTFTDLAWQGQRS